MEAREVLRLLEERFNEEADPEDYDEYGAEDFWGEVFYHESYGDSKSLVDKDDVTITVVETFGGEGQGDTAHIVLRVKEGYHTRFFKKTGGYASYDGFYWDGELTEVKPVQRVVTFYEETNEH